MFLFSQKHNDLQQSYAAYTEPNIMTLWMFPKTQALIFLSYGI